MLNAHTHMQKHAYEMHYIHVHLHQAVCDDHVFTVVRACVAVFVLLMQCAASFAPNTCTNTGSVAPCCAPFTLREVILFALKAIAYVILSDPL
jgi:hypothetical protein